MLDMFRVKLTCENFWRCSFYAQIDDKSKCRGWPQNKNINKQKNKKKMINPKKLDQSRSKMAIFLAEPETSHHSVTPTALLEGTEDTKIKRTTNAWAIKPRLKTTHWIRFSSSLSWVKKGLLQAFVFMFLVATMVFHCWLNNAWTLSY